MFLATRARWPEEVSSIHCSLFRVFQSLVLGSTLHAWRGFFLAVNKVPGTFLDLLWAFRCAESSAALTSTRVRTRQQPRPSVSRSRARQGPRPWSTQEVQTLLCWVEMMIVKSLYLSIIQTQIHISTVIELQFLLNSIVATLVSPSITAVEKMGPAERAGPTQSQTAQRASSQHQSCHVMTSSRPLQLPVLAKSFCSYMCRKK